MSQPTLSKLRNRVKKLVVVKASELEAHGQNWRTHPKSQSDALRTIVGDVGFVQPILAIETKSGKLKIVDGHLRAGVAADEKVPVIVLDLTETEAKKVLATLDPLTTMAKADMEVLHDLVKTLDSADQEIVSTTLNDTLFWGMAFDYDDMKNVGNGSTPSATGSPMDVEYITVELSSAQAEIYYKAIDQSHLKEGAFVAAAARSFLEGKWSAAKPKK
jgi:hypothetical protein